MEDNSLVLNDNDDVVNIKYIDSDNCDYILKYILVGDSNAGIASFCSKFIYDEFNQDLKATVGVEFAVKNIEIRNKVYKIQMWDTVGIVRYESFKSTYYKGSKCAIFIYDVNNKNSFDHIVNWFEECKMLAPKTITMVLVGNKRGEGIEKKLMRREKNWQMILEFLSLKLQFNWRKCRTYYI